MKRFWVWVLCLALPVAAEGNLTLGGQADRISVIDDRFGATALVGVMEDQALVALDVLLHTVKARIPLGFEPLVTAYDPSTGLVYVAGATHNQVAVVDLAQKKVLKEIDLKGGVFDLALSPNRQILVATHPGQQRISVVDLKTGVVRSIPTPQAPLACAVAEKTGDILITLDSGPLGLLILDHASGEAKARLPSGTLSEDMALDETHNRAILLNSGSDDLSVVPLDLSGQTRTIGLDWRPTRIALTRDGHRVYVTSRDNDRLQVVDLELGKVIATQVLGRQPTGVIALKDSSYLVIEAGAKQLRWARLDGKEPARTGDQTSAVAGVVKDLTGQPPSQGVLQLQGRSIPVLPDGSFLITQLPQGKHELQLQVPGFPKVNFSVQTRAGYVKTLPDVKLPPPLTASAQMGIGFLPDAPLYSDLLARQLLENLTPRYKDTNLLLLDGPLGPHQQFAQFEPLLKDLNLLDRDLRYTADLEKLKVVGRSLNLRYLVFTQVQSSRGYNTQGNALLNSALHLFIPFFPLEIPNFSPNQLHSQGLVIVLDLEKSQVGDRAKTWQANAQDEAGGEPLFEEAADGLFRQEIVRLAQTIDQQWQQQAPFPAL